MEDEGLALVCASIGKFQPDEHGQEQYSKSPDCFEHLRDLQRFLRRDHPLNRNVFLQLGKWNIVRQDLVQIIKRYSDDFDLVLSCVKVLVYLTMPIDPASHQVALQGEYLQQFTAAIVEGDAIAHIVSLLEEPLQHLESESMTDEDWKMFQLFLTLLRNLLSCSNCTTQQGPSGSVVLNLRDQVLDRVFSESAMELVIALGQHVAEHGLKKDNLLLLEIIKHVFSGQRADLVASVTTSNAKGQSAKRAVRSAESLRLFLHAEKEQLRRYRYADAPYTGMFLQVTKDGSKAISTKTLYQSPLESLARKPQVKRGVVKRIAQETHPVVPSSDRICALLKDFADQFLATGYNILMQSVKEDIRRERVGLEDSDIVTFLQVSQFFTSYRCWTVQMDQNNRKKGDGVNSDGTRNEPEPQKHLCGLIASTMDEEMLYLVLSKWREYAETTQTSKDYEPMGIAGRTMKDLIRMLDVIMKSSGPHTKEGQQEQRTARILLYKLFYDQTEQGVLSFLNSIIRSFDIYKQHRSQLIDLVEVIHIILRLLESFEKIGEHLRVLKKVRGGSRKKKKLDSKKIEPPGSKQAGEDDVATEQGEFADKETNGVDASVPAMAGPQDVAQDMVSEREDSRNEFSTHGEEQASLGRANCNNEGEAQEKKEEEEEEKAEEEQNEEEEERLEPSAAQGSDDATSDSEQQRNTTEVSFNIRSALSMFANNVTVQKYCWLLKFYSSNGPSVNHYIVRFLQRVCEDCMLEPMLYQVSILQTLYNILSDRTMQAAQNQIFVMSFLSKLVGNLLKKLESHPILFVDILFWKTRLDCHNISADYMIQSLRQEKKESSQKKPTNIADALGDDDDLPVTAREPDDDSSGSDGASGESEGAEADGEAPSPGLEEERLRSLFERYRDEEKVDELIASELDPSRSYSATQVRRKLRKLGLLKTTRNRFSMERKSRTPAAEKTSSSGISHPEKTKKKGTPKSRVFSKDNDEQLKELYTRYGSGRNVTKVITENLGGEFTIAQVSRRLRALGLVKPKPKRPDDPLHAKLSDVEEDVEASHGGCQAEQNKASKQLRKRNAATAVDLSDEDDVPLNRLLPGKMTALVSGDESPSHIHPQAHDFESESQFSKYTGREGMDRASIDDNTSGNTHVASSSHVSRRLRRINASKRDPEAVGPPASHTNERSTNLEDEDEHESNKFDDLWDRDTSPSKPDSLLTRKRKKNLVITVSDSDDDFS